MLPSVLVHLLVAVGVLLAACAPAPRAPSAAAPTLQPPSARPIFPTPELAPTLASAVGESEWPGPAVLVQARAGLAFVPLYVAQRKGFFDAEGVKVAVYEENDEAALAQKLLLEQAQLVVALGGFEVAAQRRGAAVLNVYNYLHRNLRSVAVRADLARELGLTPSTPLARKLAALKGLVVGVPSVEGAGGQEASYYARAAGLRPGDDLRIVAAGAGLSLISNLEVGLVDAIVATTPTLEHALARGRAVALVDNPRGEDPELAPYNMASLYTTASLAERYPNTTARLVRAVDRATQWVATSAPERVVETIRPFFQDEDFVVLVAGVSSLQQAINPSGALSLQAAENQLKVQRTPGLSAQQLAATFTDTYLRLARTEAR
ncbi:MAG: ABC transporter substrate-binding protein [Chloroflexi bacterium]|nr:ABC transporter substrate-binding protein [Chloroflexota bacterium]